MKKLTIEEKAKAYDEAKARMSRAYNSNRCTIGFMNEIFPELKESEDEKIRKRIIHLVNKSHEQGGYALHKDEAEEMIAYLEKQAEHANFRNKIQIGDKVTRNRDGVLVNLSQLNRVAKKDEKQGEQKSAWSEEDEERVEEMIEYLEKLYDRNRVSLDELNDKKHWLKSLRPQSQWKPSDEQIHWLKWVVNRMPDTEKANEAEAVLEELLEQLKRLRGGGIVMKYKIYKNWYNGGKQFIEETNDGDYADKRVKELNKRIDSHHKNQPINYSLETI